jgi:glutathione S-transferase
MMRLRSSSHSPYVRKVCVVAHELGIWPRIELVPTKLRTDNPEFWDDNPLAKIPVLTTEDGTSYFDSDVICEYLDATFGNRRLLAIEGPPRWHALTTMALADGVTAAGMLVRQENLKPAERRSGELISLQMGKVDRGLDRLQRDIASRSSDFDLAGIATACAIGWLAFRFGDAAIIGGRDELRAWYETVAARPSMRATVPVEPA